MMDFVSGKRRFGYFCSAHYFWKWSKPDQNLHSVWLIWNRLKCIIHAKYMHTHDINFVTFLSFLWRQRHETKSVEKLLLSSTRKESRLCNKRSVIFHISLLNCMALLWMYRWTKETKSHRSDRKRLKCVFLPAQNIALEALLFFTSWCFVSQFIFSAPYMHAHESNGKFIRVILRRHPKQSTCIQNSKRDGENCSVFCVSKPCFSEWNKGRC